MRTKQYLNTRYTKLLAIIGVSVLLTLAGCSKKEAASPALTEVTLAIGYIPNMQFAPLYVAMEQGFFTDKGIKLNIEYGMGSDILSLLASQRVDLALGDADQYLLALANGLPLAALFPYYTTLPTAIMSVDPSIQSPADLRGKRIGVSELFGSSYLTLLEFLNHYQIDSDEVTIVRVGYTQLAALSSGLVDAAVVFANNEPLSMAGQPYQVWGSEQFSNLAGSLIMANSQSRLSASQLEAFNLALEQGILFTRTHPEEAAGIATGFIDGSIYEDVRAGIVATLAFYGEGSSIDNERLEYTQQRLEQLDLM